MTIYYLDASAQVKYFITEPGSGFVRQIVDEIDARGRPVSIILVAEISIVKVAAALAIVRPSDGAHLAPAS